MNVTNLLKNLAGIAAGILFAVSAAYAISGGPHYPGSANIVGTYAGVLVPTPTPAAVPTATPSPTGTPTPTPAPTPPDPNDPHNSIGIFSVGVPQSGLATGVFVMFTQGRVFNGSIEGVGDPEKATLKGILTARFDFRVTPFGGGSSIPVTASANGNIKAKVVNSSQSFPSVVGATRLRGNATLFISQGEVDANNEPIITQSLALKVRGFKQSDTATAPTTANPAPSTAPASPTPNPTVTPTATPTPTP